MTIARAVGKKPVFRPPKYTWIQMQKGSMSVNLKCRWWTTSALSSSLLSWSCGWWRYLVEKMNSWSVGHCRAVEQTLGLRYRIEFFTRPGSRGMAWHGVELCRADSPERSVGDIPGFVDDHDFSIISIWRSHMIPWTQTYCGWKKSCTTLDCFEFL